MRPHCLFATPAAIVLCVLLANAAPAPFAKPDRGKDRPTYETLARDLAVAGLPVTGITREPTGDWKVCCASPCPRGTSNAINWEFRVEAKDRAGALAAVLKDRCRGDARARVKEARDFLEQLDAEK